MMLVRGVSLVAMCALLSGCGVYMAANQPDAKNVELFKPGTERKMLLAEFGQPAGTQVVNERKYEIFKFVNGYSTGAKVGRAVFHGAADVLTLGLWEVVATPTEAVFSGDELAYQVGYDHEDKVQEVIPLKK